MAENKQIKLLIGGLLENYMGVRYRILYSNSDMLTLCEVNAGKKCIITMHNTDYIKEQIHANKFKVIEADGTAFVHNTDDWTNDVRKKFEKKRRIIEKLQKFLAPTYYDLMMPAGKTIVHDIAKEEGISTTTLWRYIKKYLQSGFDIYSLADARHQKPKVGYGNYNMKQRNGRPSVLGTESCVVLTPDLLNIFQEGLKHYKSGRCVTIMGAYHYILNKYFTESYDTADGVICVEMPSYKVPTYKQFYYFVSKNMSEKERYILKNSAREYKNNQRALLSDAMYSVRGPADRCQMDEVEVNISLVSTIDPDQTVGRPIVYVISDVFSRMILAVGVGFDNNSLIGLTNCLQNLIEDKTEYCKKYGIILPSPNIWPTGYLPARILCDRGAEYKSKQAKKIFNDLGITLELVPPAMGSLKGIVEQTFNQLDISHKASTEKHGGMSRRHDSKHHKEACLTIDDFTKMLLNFVITHNEMYMPDYPLNKDMIAQHVEPRPVLLWQYGCETFGEPMRITNIEQFKYNLLTREKASFSKKGLCWNGLYYMNFHDRDLLYKASNIGSKRETFDVRMDPRDIGCLYYLRDGNVEAAPLNGLKHGQTDFVGLNKAEYELIRQMISKQNKEGKYRNNFLKANLMKVNNLIVDTAKKVNMSNDKNIEIARSFEKKMLQQRYLLFKGMQGLVADGDKKELSLVFGFTGDEAWLEAAMCNITIEAEENTAILEAEHKTLIESTEEIVEDESNFEEEDMNNYIDLTKFLN